MAKVISFWWPLTRCALTPLVAAERLHGFDEWFMVVEGSYVLTLNGEEVRVGAGQEYFTGKGTRIAGRVPAGDVQDRGRLLDEAIAGLHDSSDQDRYRLVPGLW